MENLELIRKMAEELNKNEDEAPLRKSGRPRSMTVLKLQWLAERVRKCAKLKDQIDNGSYHVDSKEVAKKILNIEE